MPPMDYDPSQYEFVQVVEERDLMAGQRIVFEVDDVPIALFNVSGQYYAIGDICTHDNGPLGDGELEEYQIICPRHGARFDIRTGKVLSLPAIKDTPWYPTRTSEGWVEVGLPK